MTNILPPPALRPWLLFPGSFMQQLRRNGIQHPTIRVLSQHWQLPHAHDRHVLTLPFRSIVFIRDVLIESDNAQWMFARTLIPHRTLTGAERQLAHLKTRPIGKVLFRHPRTQRSRFEIAHLSKTELWQHYRQASASSAWQRRSVFTLGQKSLLLTEVFLPDFIRWLTLAR